MKIISTRVIRPKNRESAVLANVEITFDTGIKLLNMHLLKSSKDDASNYLKMPYITTPSGVARSVYNPITKEIRAMMTKAANEALAAAVEKGVNDLTVPSEELDPKDYRVPKFSSIQVHRFDNDKPVRAFASVLMDDAVVINRLAIVRDQNTGMLVVRIPTHPFQNKGKQIGYYRIQGAAYDQLYQQVMEAYTNRPAEEEDGLSA